ncbi:hypothetical protein FHG87_012734 [Trinorchestia longiramus]|nr:hypothetical protein FHG87_012734 [Trinorchestia longiramus]
MHSPVTLVARQVYSHDAREGYIRAPVPGSHQMKSNNRKKNILYHATGDHFTPTNERARGGRALSNAHSNRTPDCGGTLNQALLKLTPLTSFYQDLSLPAKLYSLSTTEKLTRYTMQQVNHFTPANERAGGGRALSNAHRNRTPDCGGTLNQALLKLTPLTSFYQNLSLPAKLYSLSTTERLTR